MRRVLAGVSIVVLAVLAQACLLGRNLYLVEGSPAAEQEVNATETDGGPGPSGEAPGQTDGGKAPGTPGAPASDAGPPDSGPSPGPITPPNGMDPKPTCPNGTAAEREPNGTIDVANALLVGKTCGALALGDTDWFTMDVPANGLLRVAFEADGDARLLIQSAGGGIALATGSGGNFNFTTEGRWNLRVVSDTGRAQAYALTRP